MAIGDWTETQLDGHIKRLLGSQFGIVPLHRVIGKLNTFTLKEQSAEPPAPDADEVAIFAIDDGGGKTVLMARFHTGASQTLAQEP